jgi:hypothetical protein
MIITDGGRPPARSEDKYRRVCWKFIHHHAYSTRPLLTEANSAESFQHRPQYTCPMAAAIGGVIKRRLHWSVMDKAEG